MKEIAIIFILLSVFSCSKQKNLEQLNRAMKNADAALVSSDREFIRNTINDLGALYEVFPESRSVRHKKATLEIRLRDYEAAIETFNNLLVINPDEIEFRIPMAIIQEVSGHLADSRNTLDKALYYINLKIKKYEDSKEKLGEEKYYSRKVNRILILKLLGEDTHSDYYSIFDDNNAHKYPDVIKAVNLLMNSRRDELINKYR